MGTHANKSLCKPNRKPQLSFSDWSTVYFHQSQLYRERCRALSAMYCCSQEPHHQPSDCVRVVSTGGRILSLVEHGKTLQYLNILPPLRSCGILKKKCENS